MLLLLPPSETKRDGGEGGVLALERLSFDEFTPIRAALVDAVTELAGDPDAMMRALKLGPRQAVEVTRNAALAVSPTMPAIDRYTGVLYDALDAPTLDDSALAYAGEHVFVHSALFGLVGALDPIPAYRLSHDSRLPGRRLRDEWRAPIASTLAAHDGVIVDLRSEGYVGLGPATSREGSHFVRVVAEDESGRKRALNHFNKRAKGLFTRALLEQRPAIESIDDLLSWAASAGIGLGFADRDADADPAGDRSGMELELVV
ncbi:peroxide stress protein YaaA [Agromyces protaetiae]|uniref:Peroxide stress protein YaaA n=1 Tax=Agromyces protaetiae TaxID=2509455 RepID=A0A4V0YHE8_9MICO|nr:peroxide stress protein YaaA [Agromyces protaetiae]QAY74461.1 peroxide stress protein YaaA [Agromyces protaetiae]